MNSKAIINQSTLTAIGDAIREKKGVTSSIKAETFADEILSIGGGRNRSRCRLG